MRAVRRPLVALVAPRRYPPYVNEFQFCRERSDNSDILAKRIGRDAGVMVASEKRRRKRLKAAQARQAQLRTHEEIPTKSRRSIWIRIRDHWIFWALGVVSAVVGIAFPVFDALSGPEIHPSSAQVDDPFALGFSIRNPSYLFEMRNVDAECLIVEMSSGIGTKIGDVIVHVRGHHRSLGPKERARYVCPLRSFFRGIGVESVHNVTIVVHIKYDTIGRKRSYQSQVMNWNERTRQWFEGPNL